MATIIGTNFPSQLAVARTCTGVSLQCIDALDFQQENNAFVNLNIEKHSEIPETFHPFHFFVLLFFSLLFSPLFIYLLS